jgi:heme/copper-type cytochrome/quinol oxidase subunit 2
MASSSDPNLLNDIHPSTRRPVWLLTSLVVLVILFVPVSFPAPPAQERIFRIQAGNFAYSPATLQVNPGDRVTIELVSTDVVHGIYVDGYDLELTADPGQASRLSFIADRSGSFRFRCSVTCGALHPFMIGKLKVGTNWLLWKGLFSAGLVSAVALWMANK